MTLEILTLPQSLDYINYHPKQSYDLLNKLTSVDLKGYNSV